MKKIKALTIATDGTIGKAKLSTLRDYQKIVGGYIERVDAPGGSVYVNEEGLLFGLELNRVASLIVGVPLVGPAIVTGPDDGNGNDTNATKEQERFIDSAWTLLFEGMK